MSKYAANLVDIPGFLHAETLKAVLVSDTGQESRAKWLPKSQCELVHERGNAVIVTMPEWLAIDKGLI